MQARLYPIRVVIVAVIAVSAARALGAEEPAAPRNTASSVKDPTPDAGSPRAVVERVDPALALTIGDPFVLRFRIAGSDGAKVLLPAVSAKDLEPFHLIESRIEADWLHLKLAPMAVGSLTVPSIDVPYRTASGASGTVRSDPVPVEVVSVLGSEADASSAAAELADLKPPAEIHPDWRRALPWALAGVSVLAAAAAAVLLWRRRARRPALAGGIDPLGGADPADWARDALEKLMAAGHIERKEWKRFHVGLAAILRLYLEYRYRISAPERTTEEIDDELAAALVADEVRRAAVSILSRSDAVKFADAPADATSCTAAVRETAALVERSRPRRDQPAEQPPALATGVGAGS